MNRDKRQLSEDESIDQVIQKLRKTNTCIEQMPNEIFYEIFDYLDSCDIFDAFSNLNQRFNNLVHFVFSTIKICRSTSSNRISDDCYQQLVVPNRNRIISYHVYGESHIGPFLLLRTIDASFNRLESLVLYRIQGYFFTLLFPYLTTLPCLFSLKIGCNDRSISFSTLFNLILRLPALKYNKISAVNNFASDLSPLNTNGFSPMEHLVIDGACRFYDLIAVISYTPRLRHLTCRILCLGDQGTKTIIPNICNLRYASIHGRFLKFDVFEILIKKWFSQVRVLRFATCSVSSYLDADRWKRLILRHMPHLRKFDFKYSIRISSQRTITQFHSNLNRFNSPFWIERKWFLELAICIRSLSFAIFTCSIQPLK
jgi:hypothetical protein